MGDVRQLIALLGEVLDVPMKGFSGLLSVVPKIPWVPGMLVRALEISHKDLLQVCPTFDYVGWKVFQPCSR